MDKVFTTTFLIIAGVILAVTIFNVVYPAVIESSHAMISLKDRIDDRLQSQIEIVHATPAAGYTNVVLVWIKNVGSRTINAIERCDVFMGPEDNYRRIPYGEGASHWTYTIENDSSWKPTATLCVSIQLEDSLYDGERYFVKVSTLEAISDEYYFSK